VVWLLFNFQFSVPHFFRLFHINRLMAAVQVNDDGDGHGSLSGGNGDDENGKEKSIHSSGPEIFIKSDKVQVHAVQDQFNTHEHGDQVPAGEEPVHANEKEGGADE
jgi:hypothetical protein